MGIERPSTNPSLLSDIKTVTLEFITFKRKASSTGGSGAIGFGLLGGAAGGPVGAAIGMCLGLVAGEVTHVRTDPARSRKS